MTKKAPTSKTAKKPKGKTKKPKEVGLTNGRDAVKKSGIVSQDAAAASPTLADYLARIGATPLNFRAYSVKQTGEDGYSRESGRVIVQADGTLHYTGGIEPPTENEQAIIERELESFTPPTSILANDAQLKNLMSGTKGEGVTVYPVFRRGVKDAGGANVAMVQVRTDKDGAKTCVPWTYFSDGHWRPMLPDGALPFFKCSAERTASRVMVHEGPKAAMGAQAKAADPTHPWSDFLSRYEHWGIMGGAYNASTSDYDELHAHKPDEVVYVCDNDKPGVGMLQPFSRCAKGLKVNGLVFNSSFPDRFDLGDPVPEKFIDERKGFYIGPELKSLMQAATWATERYENEEGKKRTRLLRVFTDQWMHTVSPEFFIHEDFQQQVWREKEFENLVAPYRDRCEMIALMRESATQKQATTGYRPVAREPGQVFNVFTESDTGKRVLNLCTPIAINPWSGDFSDEIVRPWLDYLARMFADDRDNYYVKQWVANFIARPQVRILYGLLLISEKQGVGKTTLGNAILAPIIGRQHHSMPSATEICGNFNGWMAYKRLVTVDEIFSNDNRGAYDILKSAVTETRIRINEKNIPAYNAENWAHFILTSNHWDGLRLEGGERRWLVPKVTEVKAPPAFWDGLHHWLERDDGHAKIVRWAYEFCKTPENWISPGDGAPVGTAKNKALTETYSDGMRWVQSLLKRIQTDEPENAFVLDCDIRKYLTVSLYGSATNAKVETPKTIAKVARAEGWHIGERNNGCKGWGLNPYLGRVISRDPDIACLTPAQLAERGLKPVSVSESGEL